MPAQKDSILTWLLQYVVPFFVLLAVVALLAFAMLNRPVPCLLYTSDAADE